MLDEVEENGQAPMFIDAFYDHDKTVAHVVLNMKALFAEVHLGMSKEAVRAWGTDTTWHCEWTSMERIQHGTTQTVAAVQGYTNVDATVDANFIDDSTFPATHWAMVVSCPTISTLNGSSSARLTLSGFYVSPRRPRVLRHWVYNRSGIPISESGFGKRDVDFAICTMVDRGPLSSAEYLVPWAKYHLGVGFTQLLVYVEEKDTSWVEDALRSFIKKDQVAIVPFYFGKASDKKAFLLQGAMENHCVYRARGMAKWIAHMDVDEYFDFLRPDVSMRNFHLPKANSKDVSVVVRNQFWGTLPSSHRVDAPYPCHLNGKSEYIHPVGKRSKVIMRPEHIRALFPHFVVKEEGYNDVYPDPTTELRLNHFKMCDAKGQGCFGTAQQVNSTFKQLIADDSDWQRRCSDILAAER
jgi:hypothetical protein